MRPNLRLPLLAAALLLCLLAATAYLWIKTPPKSARLLPESDAIVFLNLAPLRAATHFDRSPVTHAPAYQQFIDATGIVFERDLDQAAFALNRMSNPAGPNGPVAFSEIFEGRFDAARLSRYLESLATAREAYAGHTIYSIPSDARTLRVALLSGSRVAVSNAPTPEQIHAILDRDHTLWLPGSSLLGGLYPDVPTFASAWAIGQIALPFSENGRVSLAGLTLPIPPDANFAASLRYTSALHLRVDQIAPSEAEATRSARALNTLLNLFRGLQFTQAASSPTPGNTSLLEALDSIQIAAHHDRATLTATVPPTLLKQLTPP